MTSNRFSRRPFSIVFSLLLACGDARIARADIYSAIVTTPLPPSISQPENEFSSLYLASDGHFYGTDANGGSNGEGSIFRVEVDGSATTLHSFSPIPGPSYTNADGVGPLGGVIEGADGALYGTTYSGGTGGEGVVFRITFTGQFSIVHSFAAANASGFYPEGAFPYFTLTRDRTGNLYGTTSSGGQPNGGTVFEIALDRTFSVLYRFGTTAATSGDLPNSGLTYASDGNLYGITGRGGGNGDPGAAGSLYKLTPAGDLTVVYPFTYEAPYGTLIEGDNGKLYIPYNREIFSFTKEGQLEVLATQEDGYSNQALAKASDGDFYGTTLGGPFSGGSIFKMTPSGTITTLYYFGANFGDPSSPNGVVFGSDGNLYGTSLYGGDNNEGALFKLPLPPPDGWGSGAVPQVTASVVPTAVHHFFGKRTATLSWSSTGAQGCALSSSDGSLRSDVATGGSITVKPKLKKTGVVYYFVSCTGLRQGATKIPLNIEY